MYDDPVGHVGEEAEHDSVREHVGLHLGGGGQGVAGPWAKVASSRVTCLRGGHVGGPVVHQGFPLHQVVPHT